MSFGWEPEKIDKEYETKGTVVIGTDEYRDLINENCRLRAAGQKEHDDWYREYSRANDLEKSVKRLESAIAEFNEWLDSDDSLRPKFKLWRVEKMESKEREA